MKEESFEKLVEIVIDELKSKQFETDYVMDELKPQIDIPHAVFSDDEWSNIDEQLKLEVEGYEEMEETQGLCLSLSITSDDDFGFYIELVINDGENEYEKTKNVKLVDAMRELYGFDCKPMDVALADQDEVLEAITEQLNDFVNEL